VVVEVGPERVEQVLRGAAHSGVVDGAPSRRGLPGATGAGGTALFCREVMLLSAR
jgi:hypothetical protein